MELKVGLKLYRNQGAVHKPLELTVNKVGHKYFEVDGARGRFNKETMRYDNSQGGNSYQLYESAQTIIDENERNRIIDKIRKEFSFHTHVRLSLDQLREIDKIINP